MKNIVLKVYTSLAVTINLIMAGMTIFTPELAPFPMSVNIVWVISLAYMVIFTYANLTRKPRATEKRNKIRKIEFDDSNNIRIIK